MPQHIASVAPKPKVCREFQSRLIKMTLTLKILITDSQNGSQTTTFDLSSLECLLAYAFDVTNGQITQAIPILQVIVKT